MLVTRPSPRGRHLHAAAAAAVSCSPGIAPEREDVPAGAVRQARDALEASASFGAALDLGAAPDEQAAEAKELAMRLPRIGLVAAVRADAGDELSALGEGLVVDVTWAAR